PDRPARGAGLRRRRERAADADRVQAPLPARAGRRPRLDTRRAAAEALGPPRVASRPNGRRLRTPSAREDRPPRVPAHIHPDALRRRLQARSRPQELTRRSPVGRPRGAGAAAPSGPMRFGVVAHTSSETNTALTGAAASLGFAASLYAPRDALRLL